MSQRRSRSLLCQQPRGIPSRSRSSGSCAVVRPTASYVPSSSRTQCGVTARRRCSRTSTRAEGREVLGTATEIPSNLGTTLKSGGSPAQTADRRDQLLPDAFLRPDHARLPSRACRAGAQPQFGSCRSYYRLYASSQFVTSSTRPRTIWPFIALAGILTECPCVRK